MKKEEKKYEDMFNALNEDVQKRSKTVAIAHHLARVLLYDLKGVDALYPDFKQKFLKLQEVMAEQEKPIYVVNSFRSAQLQDYYYSLGRTKGGDIITNAKGLESYHQYGLAIDVAFEKHNWNPPNFSWWSTLATEVNKLGMTSGYGFKDYGHVGWHPDFTWKDLKPYYKA